MYEMFSSQRYTRAFSGSVVGSDSRSQLLLVHALVLHRKDARVGVMVPGAVLQLAEAEISKRLVPFQRLDVARRQRLAVLGQQLVQQGDGRLGCPAVNILLCQLALGNQALDRVRFRREVGFQARDLLLLQVPRIVPGALL